MKTKATETKFKSTIPLTPRLLSAVLCLEAIVLICSSVPAQNLFVTDGIFPSPEGFWAGGLIYEITPDGVRRTFASGLVAPEGLAFDRAGNLFVSVSADGAIYKFTPEGVRSTFTLALSVIGELGRGSLAFDATGNLFIADWGNADCGGGDGVIYKFSADGVRTTFASGLNYPKGLAFDNSGNLFVTDLGDAGCGGGDGSIYKFTPEGVRTTVASGRFEGLAFDSAGNLFVSVPSDGVIYKFTPEGVRSRFASKLADPKGLAFDSVGNLFVLEYGGGGLDDFDPGFSTIRKFTPDGVRSTVGSIGSAYAEFLAIQPTQTSNTLSIPTISPDGGNFRRRAMVRLTDTAPGASIYYTLDGSDPTTSSTLYLRPFKLKHSAAVKAMAVEAGLGQSAIATATFTIRRR